MDSTIGSASAGGRPLFPFAQRSTNEQRTSDPRGGLAEPDMKVRPAADDADVPVRRLLGRGRVRSGTRASPVGLMAIWLVSALSSVAGLASSPAAVARDGPTTTLLSRDFGDFFGSTRIIDFLGASTSANGNVVAFESRALPDVTQFQVWVRDVVREESQLMSRANGGLGATANGPSSDAAISANGRFVAFASGGTNLDPDDSDTMPDIFLRDRLANTTSLVSRATGSHGAKGNGQSMLPSVSADGRFVAFASESNNLDTADTDGSMDVYVRDRSRKRTVLVSRDTGADANDFAISPSISGDGGTIAFSSSPDPGAPDGAIFVRSRPFSSRTATTTLASRADGYEGAPLPENSRRPSLSQNGRFLAFVSRNDVFRRDLRRHRNTLVSVPLPSAPAGSGGGSVASISANGNVVAFQSSSRLDPDDTDIFDDIFVRNIKAGTTELASRGNGSNGPDGVPDSFRPSISANGRAVAFDSSVAILLDPADGDGQLDVFLRRLG
jgi:Tol biopolymer transport system component